MRTRTLLVALGVMVASGAHAGPYDFDFKRVNDMRKAFVICAFTGYQEGDCPEVLKKCFQPPMLEWDGDSKCEKPPKFTPENEDAKQALRDANEMSGVEQTPPSSREQENEAFALNERADMGAEDPCEASTNRRACAAALAVDNGGVGAYEEAEYKRYEEQYPLPLDVLEPEPLPEERMLEPEAVERPGDRR